MRIFPVTFLALWCLIGTNSFGQGTAINTSGGPADNSAMLDVAASNKGILVPRIPLTDTADAVTIQLPATSLLVYNTTNGNGLVPGFYYNKGLPGAPKWAQLLPNPANTNLNMNNFKITNLATCTNNPDAANKAYVDAQVALVGGSGGSTLPTMISNESASTMNIMQACDYCRTLTENTYSDWWLPSMDEVMYVISTTNATIPNGSSPNLFWTRTIDYGTGYYFSYMRFSDGYVWRDSGSALHNVRCVR